MIDPASINCVIYHASCNDGMGAAYAAWKLLGNKAEYIPCRHGGDLPDVKGKRVAVLDFSFDNKTTKRQIEDAEAYILIDHHKSAVIELHDLSQYTMFDLNKSGAMLAWEFFHPGKEPPKFIQYIQDRDLWAWEMPYSKEFAAAFDMVPFEFKAYEEFEDDSVLDDAIKRGSYILAYSRTVINKICEKAADRRIMINDRLYNIKIVNSSHWQSEIGGVLAKECDFAFVYFYSHNTNSYSVSLRSFHEDVDVSLVAKSFGGGGHKKAAGMNLLSHPETLFYFEDVVEENTEEYFGSD